MSTNSMCGSTSRAGAATRDADLQFTLLMRTVAFMHQQHYHWVYTRKLAGAIQLGPATSNRIEAALAAGCFKPGSGGTPNTISLNLEHAETYSAWWLYAVLNCCVNKRRMPYVSMHYLKNGMELDGRLQTFGIGPGWSAIHALVRRAVHSGVVVKKTTIHPSTGKKIATWQLAASGAGFLHLPALTPRPPITIIGLAEHARG